MSLFPGKTLTLVPEEGRYRRYHLHETDVGEALRAAARKAKLDKRVTAHTFRNSFASHPLEAGSDIRTVQELLGHAKVETAQRYTHVAENLSGAGAHSPLDRIAREERIPEKKPEREREAASPPSDREAIGRLGRGNDVRQGGGATTTPSTERNDHQRQGAREGSESGTEGLGDGRTAKGGCEPGQIASDPNRGPGRAEKAAGTERMGDSDQDRSGERSREQVHLQGGGRGILLVLRSAWRRWGARLWGREPERSGTGDLPAVEAGLRGLKWRS